MFGLNYFFNIFGELPVEDTTLLGETVLGAVIAVAVIHTIRYARENGKDETRVGRKDHDKKAGR